MNDHVSISIKLCNRAYKIKVAAENEATVRSTAQAINDKLADIKKNFPGRDDEDYLAMTLIDYMTSVKDETQNKLIEVDEIIHELEAINNLLDS
jgi:cell division protein ZapA (FtsZ GTPase activity inhibitor)